MWEWNGPWAGARVQAWVGLWSDGHGRQAGSDGRCKGRHATASACPAQHSTAQPRAAPKRPPKRPLPRRTSRDCASPTYTMALTEGIHLRNSLGARQAGRQGGAGRRGWAGWERVPAGWRRRGGTRAPPRMALVPPTRPSPYLIQLGTVESGTTTRKGPAIICTSLR